MISNIFCVVTLARTQRQLFNIFSGKHNRQSNCHTLHANNFHHQNVMAIVSSFPLSHANRSHFSSNEYFAPVICGHI